MIKKFNTVEDISKYLVDNPTFASGFVSGEGCFTVYIGIDTGLTWGLQWGCEFSVAQNSGDKLLLEGINNLFGNIGKVYDRKTGVDVLLIRNIKSLKNTIIPFFNKYPLVGTKSFEFDKFSHFIDLVLTKKHLGRTLENRDAFINLCSICKDINSKYGSKSKLIRLNLILDWLSQLEHVPSMDQKENLKILIADKLISLKNV